MVPQSFLHNAQLSGLFGREGAMASSLDRIRYACQGVGISVQALYDLPFPSIVEFARQNNLALRELAEVCAAMLAELAAIEEHVVSREGPRTH